MDGLLVIDKPSGPTSHDVVARIRRILRERRIGHTGTLDPLATGALPLVVGRATRLARFLSAGDKAYRAVIRLGVRTDTGDVEGDAVGTPWSGPLPSLESIEAALTAFRGSFRQAPPVFSAKKIAGRRSYSVARAGRGQGPPAQHELPQPVVVTVHSLRVIALDADRLTLDVHCSAGFYVRSLADDVGERLGTGGHLVELRRTRSGDVTLDDAMTLEEAERDPAAAIARVVPMGRMLPALSAVTLTAQGLESAVHGRDLGPAAWTASTAALPPGPLVRLLDSAGELVGIAERSRVPGLLHPFVVLM